MNGNSICKCFKPFTLFLIAWGILNLVQAWFTPLNNDEAYYWMYSNNLDWGFYDHPPMIALMIRIGYSVFHNEFGVRLIVVLSQIAALIIVWSLIDREQNQRNGKVLIFIMLVAILPVFNIYGFIATPDGPLLLFTALFLLAYKRIINKENWQNSLFLGFSMAALMYSKYHGALLIILVILSNPGLLKRTGFIMSVILAVILFLPHLYWQYSNGFPSIEYHLVDRVSGFTVNNVPEYLLNQLLIHNLLLLPVCIWLIMKRTTKDKFVRALNYIITGFFAFFFIASFRYHIEPQWTALISIPMIIILLNNLDLKQSITGYIIWITIIIFPVFIFARIALMVDFLPVSFLKNEYHKNKRWADEISRIAGNRPVIFTNSYQDPSEYTFYTGKFAHSLNNLSYRKTQFDLWDFEERVHGKEVLYVPHYLTSYYKRNLTKHILPNGDSLFIRIFKDFQSLQRECVILDDDRYTYRKNETNTIHFKLFNPYPYQIRIDHVELPVVFQLAFAQNGVLQFKKNLELPDHISSLLAGDTISVDCRFRVDDLPAGDYKLAICSVTGILYDVYNSRFRDVKITD